VFAAPLEALVNEEQEINVHQIAGTVRLIVPEHAVGFEVRDSLVHDILCALLYTAAKRALACDYRAVLLLLLITSDG